MKQFIAKIALVVRDYDEAIAFYTKKLKFLLLEWKRCDHVSKRSFTYYFDCIGSCGVKAHRFSSVGDLRPTYMWARDDGNCRCIPIYYANSAARIPLLFCL